MTTVVATRLDRDTVAACPSAPVDIAVMEKAELAPMVPSSLVWADGPPVAVVGLDNVIVVSTPQGLIVLPMDRAQDVKLAVEALKARQA